MKPPRSAALVPLAAGTDEKKTGASPQTHGLAEAAPSLDAIICALLMLGAVGLTAWTSWRAYLYVPYSDNHHWIGQVFATESTHRWLAYLWAPHTEQRIPIARAVQAVDVEWARGRAPTFLIATWAAMLLGLTCLAALIGRSAAPIRVKLWIGCLCGLGLLNVAVAEDFAFPVFSVYVFVTGPALAALACQQLGSRIDLARGALVATLAFAVLASFGNAAGLAVWPVLVGGAIVQGRSNIQVRALLIGSIACVVLVEAGLGVPSRTFGGSGSSAQAHAAKMIAYFTAYGGLPWTRVIRPAWLASLFGLAIELAAIAVVFRSRPEGPHAPLERAGAAMIVMGLITALLATAGRVDELPAPIVPTRYFPFAGLLQAGLVLSCVRPLQAGLRRWPKAATVLLGVGAAAYLLAELHRAAMILRTADHIRAASAAFDAGAPAPADGVVLDPDLRLAADVRARLRARHLPY